MKATSATPLTSEPVAGLVWLDANRSVTVTRCPWRSILDMRPPV
jgi:hypothetical protein